MPYVIRRGLGTLTDQTIYISDRADTPDVFKQTSSWGLYDLSADDPILQNPNEGTTYGTRTGGQYPVNPYTGRPGGPQPSITDWLNRNSGLALGIAGGFFALMFVAKAGR